MELPEQSEIPTGQDIEELPRWARVAFGARCARRVQPLVNLISEHVSIDVLAALEIGIGLTEQAAATCSLEFADKARSTTNSAARAASEVSDTAEVVSASPSSLSSFSAAVNASESAVHAASFLSESGTFAANAARSAYFAASDAIYFNATATPAEAGRAIRRDYDLLTDAAKRLGWTDDTPVPPGFFGPIWPDGEPEGWPASGLDSRAGETQFALRVTGPPGESAEAVAENTRRLVDLIDQLNRVEGGRGITIDDDISVCDQIFFGAPTPNDPTPVGGGI